MPSPVAHTLMGLCLANRPKDQARAHPFRLRSAAVFAFFANFPDFDFIPGLAVGLPYEFHRGPAHSVVFALGVSALVWLVLKVAGSRSATFWARAAGLGMLSHIALDFFSFDAAHPSGLMVLWPFSDEMFHAPAPIFPSLHNGSWSTILGLYNVRILFEEVVVFTAMIILNELWEMLKTGAPARAEDGSVYQWIREKVLT